jgi:hypothetical protein
MNFAYQAQNLVLNIRYWVENNFNRLTANRCMTIIVWLVGAWATKVFLVELGVENNSAKFLAIVLQAFLTLADGSIWRPILRSHKVRMLMGIVAVVADVAFNTGGLWVYVRNLGNTSFWAAIASAMEYSGPPSLKTILALSAIGGLIIAAGAEALWEA